MKYYIPEEGETIDDAVGVLWAPNTTALKDTEAFAGYAARHMVEDRGFGSLDMPMEVVVIDDDGNELGTYSVDMDITYLVRKI